VIRTPRGRKVTAAAYDHLGYEPPVEGREPQRRLF
jgi:Holliday junction resolvasome RuvABC ATP-dependent DNA helicase subunit